MGDEAADTILNRLLTEDSLQRTMTRTVTEEDGLCKIITSTDDFFPSYGWPDLADPALVGFHQTEDMNPQFPMPVFLPEMVACAGWPLPAPSTSSDPASSAQ